MLRNKGKNENTFLALFFVPGSTLLFHPELLYLLLPQAVEGKREMTGLQSICNRSSLLLLSSHIFPRLQQVSSPGAAVLQDKLAPAWGLPQAVNISSGMGSSMDCSVNTCCGVVVSMGCRGIPSPALGVPLPLLLLTLVFALLFLTFFLLSSCLCVAFSALFQRCFP